MRQTLIAAFRGLNDIELAQLVKNLDAGRKLLAGSKAHYFVWDGCGCPAFLANEDAVPATNICGLADAPERWHHYLRTYHNMDRSAENETDTPFLTALKESTPEEVEEAIRAVHNERQRETAAV